MRILFVKIASSRPARIALSAALFACLGSSLGAQSHLSIFDEAGDQWKLVPGSYKFMVGGSSQDLSLSKAVTIK